MNQAKTAVPPETIEYSGIIWTKTNNTDNEFIADHPEFGEIRVYQYPQDSYSAGRWLWSVDFHKKLSLDERLTFSIQISKIVGTDRDEAMQCCLNAKEILIHDIKYISLKLGIGNYPTGFMDGQAALAAKIAQVLP
jgi:hypothetical protein